MNIPWKIVGTVAAVGVAGFVGFRALNASGESGAQPRQSAPSLPTMFLPSMTGGGGSPAGGGGSPGFDAASLMATLAAAMTNTGDGQSENSALAESYLQAQVAMAQMEYNAAPTVYSYDILKTLAERMAPGGKVGLNLGGLESSLYYDQTSLSAAQLKDATLRAFSQGGQNSRSVFGVADQYGVSTDLIGAVFGLTPEQSAQWLLTNSFAGVGNTASQIKPPSQPATWEGVGQPLPPGYTQPKPSGPPPKLGASFSNLTPFERAAMGG